MSGSAELIYLTLCERIVYAKSDRDIVLDIFTRGNIHLSEDKIEGPKQIMEMLGITYNTIKIEMYISQKKIIKFYEFLMMMLTLEVCTLPYVANFTCKAGSRYLAKTFEDNFMLAVTGKHKGLGLCFAVC